MKIDTEEIGKFVAQATKEYTDVYFSLNKGKPLNRELWAALHVGFISGMKLCGYSEEEAIAGIDASHKYLPPADEVEDKNKSPFLTRREVAKIFKVDARTVERWLASGKLKGYKLGDGQTAPWRIYKTEVDAFLKANEYKP